MQVSVLNGFAFDGIATIYFGVMPFARPNRVRRREFDC